MIKHPADLIGFFYSLHRVVMDYDPLVDKVVMQDEDYDAKMGEHFFEALFDMGNIGETLKNKIEQVYYQITTF